MKTLEEIDELGQSRFGQPHPRHGLKLLYWFAKNCLSFNQNNVMQSCCYPENGDFGFHTFENKHERKHGRLLPIVAFSYYEVGNLSKPRAYNLPHYVRKDYTRSSDNSNMDRIIVSLNNTCFDRVYVTEHRDRSNFNKDSTYHISKCLIMIIRDMTLEEFLWKTGYSKQETNSVPTSLNILQPPCVAPPTSSMYSPLQDICTNKDIPEIESPSNLMKNNTHYKASHSICSPAITSSTTQDIQKEIKSPPSLDNSTQGHHGTQPTTSICSPATTSSTNQDISTENESHPIFTNNKTQMHTIIMESELNNFVQGQTFRNSNLQTPSKDSQTGFASTPNIMSSRNQNADIESSPFSQMNLSFWGVYLFFLFLYFYFFWGDITRITVILVSSSFAWQNWKRGEQGEKKERGGKKSKVQKEKMKTNSTVEERKENERKMHTATACTPTVMSSRNQNTEIKSSPISQMNSFFWGFYLLFICSFFYFVWGNVMRIFIIAVFFYHYYSRRNPREREKKLKEKVWKEELDLSVLKHDHVS